MPAAFQDRKELASSADLGASIHAALVQSGSLILICSPNAARSRWVNQEIAEFLALGRGDRIQCFIVEGKPHSGDPETECFPTALLAHGSEPLAADARRQADGKRDAALKLIAGLIGVGFDDLKQRELIRRHRRAMILASVSTVGLAATSALAVSAIVSREEAVRQRDIAQQQKRTAERTVDFVKSLFEVSDPSEARGAQVTALNILDNGARRISGSLNDDPAVKADLISTLSEVYQNLGFYRRGDALVQSALKLTVSAPAIRARQLTVFGESQSRQGNYDIAITALAQAAALASDRENGDADLIPRVLVGLGEAQASEDNFVAAERNIRQALRADRKAKGENHPDVARDLEALGLTKNFGGDLSAARKLYQQAIAIRIRSQGEDHPRVSEDYSELGAIAYLQGDSAAAEQFWLKALRFDEHVLGPDHPDVGTTLNNIARVRLERRAFAEARPLLEQAVKISLAQRSETHDDLAFLMANLAIADQGLGRRQEAEVSFRKALTAAMAHKHRNRGPIMTDLAGLLCTEKRFAEAYRLLEEAEPLMKADYPNDRWRVAWTQNTRGDCMLRQGRGSGAVLLQASSQSIQARWAPETLYGRAVADRLSARRGHR